MRLKLLSLHGFKSFADRTELMFEQGVTAVVGPNGCGKSNVVDAMKWVLGEQSAKSLRGRQMQDVIFNGSANRKSMGMAEVAVTFETNGEFEQYGPEVVITRRLYRSGQSEYLINKNPSRLRDIRDLFLDTGIGVDAYSLIEQGKVDLLLQASNQERRAVLEEAAGISKYKVRRKEAQRRLENVEQNLLRAGDIVAEVEKRLRSVKLQAGKARNWQQYTAELQELKSQYYLAEYHRLLEDQGRLRLELDRRNEHVQDLQGRFDLLEAKRSQYDLEIVELSNEVNAMENRLTQSSGQIESGRQTISLLDQRTAEQQEHLNETRCRLHRQVLQMDRIRTEQTQVSAELDALKDQELALQARIGDLQERIHERDLHIAELAHKLETDKSGLIELMRRCAQQTNQLNQLDLEQRNIAGQRERLTSRRAFLAEEKGKIHEQREVQREALGEVDEQIESMQAQQDRRQAEHASLLHEVDELTRTLAAKKEQRSALGSRYDVLADMESHMEGVGSGAQDLLRRKDENDPAAAGLIGLVADVIRTDMGHAAVIEAALAGKDQYVVAEDSTFLTRNAERFSELGGSTHVFALDLLEPVVSVRDICGQEGVVAVACDLVRADQRYEQLVRVLLGKTLIVDDLATAIRLRAENPAGWRFVTRQGEVLEHDGAVRVGPRTGGGGLISRKVEIEHLQGEIEALDESIRDLAQHVEQVNDDQRQAEQGLSDLRARLYELRTQRVKQQTELTALDEQWDKLEREEPLIDSELGTLDKQCQFNDARRRDLAAQLDVLEAEQADLQQRIEGQQTHYQHQQQTREQLAGELTDLKVDAGRLAQKRQSLSDRANALREDLQQAVAACQSAESEIKAARLRLEQAERQILQTESRLAQLYLDRQACQTESARLRQTRADVNERMQQLHGEGQQITSQLAEEQQHTQELALKINELTVRQETLIQRVQEELKVDLEEVYGRYEPGQVDWQALEGQIDELKAKISRLGNVNLDAIAEQEELEARHVFLTSQREDLLEARKKLEELIERLDEESQKRFIETFEAVRINFQELFRKLFGGGKADIILDTPEDVLESGIDILAKPPGKELRSVSLLSGGEKTLTTVALLMAIFKSKPSPFCILDEVDAALDDANVDRFNRVLQEFLAHSQFVVITHNKQTMGYASALYGITMQEAGISKKVAVKFNKNSAEPESDHDQHEAA